MFTRAKSPQVYEAQSEDLHLWSFMQAQKGTTYRSNSILFLLANSTQTWMFDWAVEENLLRTSPNNKNKSKIDLTMLNLSYERNILQTETCFMVIRSSLRSSSRFLICGKVGDLPLLPTWSWRSWGHGGTKTTLAMLWCKQHWPMVTCRSKSVLQSATLVGGSSRTLGLFHTNVPIGTFGCAEF